jgi:hypothetical protein
LSACDEKSFFPDRQVGTLDKEGLTWHFKSKTCGRKTTGMSRDGIEPECWFAIEPEIHMTCSAPHEPNYATASFFWIAAWLYGHEVREN